MGGRMPCPARPVKDDRALALCFSFGPLQLWKVSTANRWASAIPPPPCWLSFAVASGRQGCWSRHPVRVLGAALSSDDISSPNHQPVRRPHHRPFAQPTRLPPSQPHHHPTPGGFFSFVSIPSSIRRVHFQKAKTTADVTMDTLVAKYSRPAYAQNEGFTEQDEMDFADGVPGPSLKFAMPPVAQVRPPSWTLDHTRQPTHACSRRWQLIQTKQPLT